MHYLNENPDQSSQLDNQTWFDELLVLGVGSIIFILISLRFMKKRSHLASAKIPKEDTDNLPENLIEPVSKKYPNASLSAPPPHWYLNKDATYHDSRQTFCKHLSAAYQSLYDSISQVSASCAQLAVDDVLQRLSIEAPTRAGFEKSAG